MRGPGANAGSQAPRHGAASFFCSGALTQLTACGDSESSSSDDSTPAASSTPKLHRLPKLYHPSATSTPQLNHSTYRTQIRIHHSGVCSNNPVPNIPSVRGGKVDTYSIEPSPCLASPSTLGRSHQRMPPNPGDYDLRGDGRECQRVDDRTCPDRGTDPVLAKFEIPSSPRSIRWAKIPPNALSRPGGDHTVHHWSTPAVRLHGPSDQYRGGTPTVADTATQFTVTGTNSAGSVQTNISIAVQEVVVPPPWQRLRQWSLLRLTATPTVGPPPVT